MARIALLAEVSDQRKRWPAEGCSPRVRGKRDKQVSGNGKAAANGTAGLAPQMGLRAFLTNRRWLIMLAGTAGTWFLLDYAYYGNTFSTPQILSLTRTPLLLPCCSLEADPP